jgi:prophage regulatory protein
MSSNAQTRAEESNMASPLPETGYLRLPHILGKPATENAPAIPALFPVCRSTWWAGVKSGRYPRPVKLAARITAWRVEDIRALIERVAA